QCEQIKPLKEEDKKRTAISPEDLKRITKYLSENDPYYLLVCRMEYYTFIRPEELTNIKLCDINLKEQKILVASNISKNRRDGMVGLNDEIIKQMIDLHIFDNDTNCYLFSKGFKPGYKKITTRVIRDRFYKLRSVLKLPDTYLFYSFKDSGIRDLANSAGIVVARDQARHADISTTNKYLKGSSLTVHEETKHFVGEL
uniref:tyrosine-type recombinase/integrase n=1 Tax=uncultured Bacteroides sp. TaxID=162156 RepID=UPI00259341E7